MPNPLRFALLLLLMSVAPAARSQSSTALLERLTTPLRAEQRARIGALHNEAARKRQRLAADARLSPAARVENRRLIDAAVRDGILGILDRDQRLELLKMQAARTEAIRTARKRLRASLTPDQKRRLKSLADPLAPGAAEALFSRSQLKDFMAIGGNLKALR